MTNNAWPFPGRQQEMTSLLPSLPRTASGRAVSSGVEEIDAAMFSGDLFLDTKLIGEMTDLLARWQRKLSECQEIADELKHAEGGEQ